MHIPATTACMPWRLPPPLFLVIAGTGKGTSVLEMIKAFEDTTGEVSITPICPPICPGPPVYSAPPARYTACTRCLCVTHLLTTLPVFRGCHAPTACAALLFVHHRRSCVMYAGAKVPFEVVARRPGDTVAVWAATELAEAELGWRTKLDIQDMCRDQWRWAQSYPQVHARAGVVGKALSRWSHNRSASHRHFCACGLYAHPSSFLHPCRATRLQRVRKKAV